MGGKNIRTLYRIIFASSAGAAVFLIIISQQDSMFYLVLARMLEVLSPGLEMQESVRGILFRGGALVSMIFLLYINRQIVIGVVWLIKKQRNVRGIIDFFAPSRTIWILIGSLFTVIITRLFKVEVFEIAAWNVFSICVIIFMAQGTGILMYWLLKRTPGFRFAAGVFFVIVLFSPLAAVAIASLLLLGIAENWHPFRVTVKS